MARWLTTALAVAFLVASSAPARAAEEARGKKVHGTWTKSEGDNSITFHFKPENMQVVLKNAAGTCTVDADYGVTKGNVIFGIITGVKNEGLEGPPEGMLFSFEVNVDKDTLTIKELKGSPSDEAKKAVEGDYKKKK